MKNIILSLVLLSSFSLSSVAGELTYQETLDRLYAVNDYIQTNRLKFGSADPSKGTVSHCDIEMIEGGVRLKELTQKGEEYYSDVQITVLFSKFNYHGLSLENSLAVYRDDFDPAARDGVRHYLQFLFSADGKSIKEISGHSSSWKRINQGSVASPQWTWTQVKEGATVHCFPQ